LNNLAVLEFSLEPNNSKRLANLCGQLDQHLRQIEKRLEVEIRNRGNHFSLEGEENAIKCCAELLERLYDMSTEGKELTPDDVHLELQPANLSLDAQGKHPCALGASIRTKKETIKPRGGNQIEYVKRIREYDINFGIGPAGTGKTYLASLPIK